ncbi:DUF3899 domain-containing protein [Lentilactobacillus parafarraginis]|uniref:DUF3899 domain-containing protein n=2 Tax=Lentilactobacillus parafarraginis TaxID=390842 RepID=A0A0R1YR62_9LACO|nr:DUF3899 domain-containing protein [Lentilactobacillus parafarraginis]KRM44896.1 hypothetical protein FD47_GL002776 [Lentilactobacillus parafarraginis DSM 18390 = JCM 14109]TLQ18046.1 DUF3899 domain-containing protein [Lentilactobacillus parafarraginis]
MKAVVKRYPVATGIGLIIMINLIFVGLRMPLMAVGNLDFLAGLFLLVLASIFIVGSGHLFTGWRFSVRKKTDLEAENDPKHPAAKDVASIKNRPITVNKYAHFCLLVGLFLIVLGIVLTSI